MKSEEVNNQYNDIVSLPHPVSHTRVPMSRQNRAAQFAPFAALVGHDAAVAETARLTDRRVELDENELDILDRKWQCLRVHLSEQPTVTVTYFCPDKQKDGGAYLTVTGDINKADEYGGFLYLSGGHAIPFSQIVAINSPLLRSFVGSDDIQELVDPLGIENALCDRDRRESENGEYQHDA